MSTHGTITHSVNLTLDVEGPDGLDPDILAALIEQHVKMRWELIVMVGGDPVDVALESAHVVWAEVP